MLADFSALRVPDIWQQQAVGVLRAGHDLIVQAPTGCGKTYVFELFAPEADGQCIYTVPTRALANDKLREWQALGWDVGITTGDITLRPDAKIVVATLEAQRARLLHGRPPGLLVIDEYQMLSDPQRGRHYELVLAMVPPETRLLMLSGSVANPHDIAAWLTRIGREVEVITVEQRPVPLEEIDAGGLTGRLPREVQDFWPRLVAAAISAGMGPILLFAPRRAAAEQLARSLASQLPCEDSLDLTQRQAALAGDAMAKMLRQRIAVHHSGLPYAARAGVVEPLAKAGQLRAVVATMGLAAGVNFSMRTVLVTDTRYVVAGRDHLLKPDQLLQMFGRAGRRGLDDQGYILVVPGKPRLSEARAASLRPGMQADWPGFLDVMSGAALNGSPPFAAAARLHGRLFASAPTEMGLPGTNIVERACGLWLPDERARFAKRHDVEMRNSRGQWEALPTPVMTPWAEVLYFPKEEARWRPLLHDQARIVLPLNAALGRIREGQKWWYAPEWAVGHKNSEGLWQPAKWLAKQFDEIKAWVPAPDADALGQSAAKLLGIPHPLVVIREPRLILQEDTRLRALEAFPDRLGRYLLDPETRRRTPVICEGCPEFPECVERKPKRTPAWYWRDLGLIEADGTPTRRGRLFRLFNGGEGLAIAAGLENEAYAVEEMVYELADLRAGVRFTLADTTGESRLPGICRMAFGNRKIEGLLEDGLPESYGVGAGAMLRELGDRAWRGGRADEEILLRGDVERAHAEWHSLLRQIAGGPDLDWPRWDALRKAAAGLVEKKPPVWLDDLPPLTPAQRRPMEHSLGRRA